MNVSRLEDLEQNLGYNFNNKALLIQALTHPSYAHEVSASSAAHYQRLEFLGDSILGMLLSEMLFRQFTTWDEGNLSRFRSRLVGQDMLADRARLLKLGQYILLGRGEEQSSGREKDSILADILEAVIAAVYLDGSLDTARTVIVKLFADFSNVPDGFSLGRDSKSELQERLATSGKSAPIYHMVEEDGPPHNRQFVFQVFSGENLLGTGEGRSKKTAQQSAATRALEMLDTEPHDPQP